MKKILTIILAACLICSMSACNSNNQQVADPTTSLSNTEPNTTPGTAPEIDPTTPTQINGRQEMWESVFSFCDFRLAGSSFEITKGEHYKLTSLKNKDGESFVLIDSVLEDNYFICASLYQDVNKNRYFYMSETINQELKECWLTCELEEDQDDSGSNIDFINLETSQEIVDAMNKLHTKTEVQYVHSLGDIDYIDIVCYEQMDGMQQPDNGELEVLYDKSFDIEYNGERGRIRCSETYVPSISETPIFAISWEIEIVGMELSEWMMDTELMRLVSDSDPNKTISCVLNTDHLIHETVSTTVHVAINSKTLEIHEIAWENDKMQTKITFMDCDNVLPLIAMPEDIQHTIKLNDAISQLNFAMMTFSMVSPW